MQWSYLESFQDSPSQYLKKSFTIPTQQKTCNKGQKYLTTDNTCNPCEDGTYQDATNHTFMDCKSHIEPICDNSFYLDTNEYAIRKNTTKDSTVNLDGLCLPQPSLNDLRGQCSGGYILETEYNKKLGTKKESRLTSAEVCKPHTQWDNKSTLGSCNETNKYYDRSQYNNIINNKKNANITLAEICLTIPYYPLNVKNGYNNYIANTNLNVFLKHNGQYLNISQNSSGLRLISSDNADKIPITWDNDTNKIQIKSGKFYAKIVGNKIEFVKQPNELPVNMRNGKLFVTGTNIEIDVNNCEDNQYRNSRSICVTKTNTCGPGTYFSGRYGNSGTSNDPICTPCSPGTYGTGNTKCTKCEAGTYASGTGNTKCTKCEVGTYASGTGNTTREKCKIKDNLILNGFSWPRPGQNWNISKINNKMSIDECRQHVLDEKKKGNVEYDNVIVVGHRNSKHGNPAYKNTCWYIRNNVASDNTTVNAIGHVDDVHQIACVDSDGNPIKCNISKENCDGMTGHYYSDSDNLCKPHTTCPNGQQLDGATGISAGTCKWCHELGAKYKNSGQNRSKCEDQYTCPNGKQLVGASNTSPGICKWCHELGAKYKNSGQNRSKCADQHTCPNGQQLVDASNTRPGICKWCHELGAKYKNSGQNRSKCEDRYKCPNGQQLVGASNTSPGTCKWCDAGNYKSGYNRNSCSRCQAAKFQPFKGMHSCYSATYNHASWNGYYNGDWYYFDYLPSSETHKRDGAEDENLAIYHLKRRFFNKHPTGIVRHSRIPDVFLYKRSERRAIAVWYKGIIGVNYDKNGDYISWHIA